VTMYRNAVAVFGLALLAGPIAQRTVGAQEAALEAEVLTLEEALALALKNSAAVASAELQVQRAENELAATRTHRLPTVDVQAQGTQLLTPVQVTFPAGALGVYPATGPIPATDTIIESSSEPSARVSATVAQPLTQLHKAGLAVKAGQLTRDMERQQLRVQRAAVANDVRRLYYGILQAKSALDAAHEQAKALRQMDHEVAQYVSLEASLPADRLQVTARLATQEYHIITLENALATRKEQLNTLFGRDPRTPFEVVALSTASVDDIDLEAARVRALERRPELEQARLQVELADTDRRIKKAEFIPQVSAFISYDSYFNIDLLPGNLAQVGLQVKWEPFDWGRRKKELAARTLAVTQAGYAARDQRHRVLVEVDRAFRQVREARALVAVRRLGNESAQETVRVALLRQRHQAVLLRDVLQAQAALADARAQYDEAQLALWQARADLDKAIGEDK
jgi:outer membrane protein